MENNTHWAQQKESGGAVVGIRIMLFLYALGGRFLFKSILYFVIFFYYLVSKGPRNNSKYFLSLVKEHQDRIKNELLANSSNKDSSFNLIDKYYDINFFKQYQKLSSYHHFLSFGDMILDKFASWRGKLCIANDVNFIGNSKELLLKKEEKGRIFLCSHLGNVEALRALSKEFPEFSVNAIVFTKNAKNFNSVMKELAPESNLNLIATNSIGADTAIMLKEKIDKGEIVAIVGDRIPVEKGRNADYRTVKSLFLSKECKFPEGPFVLCSILKCRVQILFGLKNEATKKYDLVLENFTEELKLNRKNRSEDLKKYVDEYAARLEYYAVRYPYQWFNFFNFFEQ